MLSIIVPTFNEASNIRTLIERIFAATSSAGIESEVVVVDDSSQDGTGEIVEGLKARFNVGVLRRPSKSGLASAVLDGFSYASGDVLCAMDADLSHDPKEIPVMYDLIKKGDADFVIGSRLVAGGGSKDWSFIRRLISATARALARPITDVRDLTSGYFMLKRGVIDGVELNPIGFKICLEIIGKGRYNKIKEVPIVFAGRVAQKSKLGAKEVLEYLVQLTSLYGLALKRKLPKKGER